MLFELAEECNTEEATKINYFLRILRVPLEMKLENHPKAWVTWQG